MKDDQGVIQSVAKNLVEWEPRSQKTGVRRCLLIDIVDLKIIT